MPDCEMCGTFTAKSYNVDLRITSNFDRDEEPFERYSTICSECRNKILKVFPKIEDDFLKVLYNFNGYLFFKISIGLLENSFS